MRIISIGDIHGRNYWKEINPDLYDLIVFVGDYMDQHDDMPDLVLLNNLIDIIEFKKKYPDKVVLILGNHDIQYYFPNLLLLLECTGFRKSMYASVHNLFLENKNLFVIAHQVGNYLWTHAGISNGWYKENKRHIDHVYKRFECVNLAEALNCMMHMGEMNMFLHTISYIRDGNSLYGGITWADRKETCNNYLEGYHQIVGHTPIREITKFGDEKGSIRYIDVLNEVYFWNQDQKKAKEKWPDYKEPVCTLTKFYEFEL